MMNQSMLVISSDLQLFESLYMFYQNQYHLELAQDELNCANKIYQLKPDVLIISYHQQRMDGIEICKHIRPISTSPIIIIGDSMPTEERIRAFEAGADDTLQSPLHPLELYYRIRVLSRRGNDSIVEEAEPNIIVFGNIVMNHSLHKVHINGEDIPFTKKEFALLWVLMMHQNQVVRRNDLVRVIWGYDHIGDDRMVDTHLNRLRKKLLTHQSDSVITTIWGLGYKLERMERKPSLQN